MSDLNSKIGARVREERTRQGLTQFDLLRRTEPPIHPTALSNLETGRREWRAGLIECVAKALGVPAHALLMDNAARE